MWEGRNALIKRRRIWFCGVCLFVAVALCAHAAHTWGQQTVYMKQTERGTCTLTAAVMLLKETARLRYGHSRSVTLANVRKTAWCEEGLCWSFTYGDNTVRRFTLPRAGRAELLKVLLAEYPQGVVVYNVSQPHAVWLTEYDASNDVFYAADPSKSAPTGKIPLAQTVLKGEDQAEKIEGIGAYWCVE